MMICTIVVLIQNNDEKIMYKIHNRMFLCISRWCDLTLLKPIDFWSQIVIQYDIVILGELTLELKWTFL